MGVGLGWCHGTQCRRHIGVGSQVKVGLGRMAVGDGSLKPQVVAEEGIAALECEVLTLVLQCMLGLTFYEAKAEETAGGSWSAEAVDGGLRIEAIPDEGYDLKEWNVRYSDGTTIEVFKENSLSTEYNYYFQN